MSSARELVEGIGDLISLPEVAIRVNNMVDDPNVNIEEISGVIAHDPALSARLLKIANSPLFGLSREVSTISRAITLLGSKRLRSLVLSTTASHAFDGIPNELISPQNFWHHSLYCGLLAQALASRNKQIQSDSIFIAGLLHDIGQLVMFNRCPEQSREALLLVLEGSEEMEMYQAEQRVFGFDHTEVGNELLKLWQLPELLQECVACHHNPLNAKRFPAEAALVHIANAAAVMAELNSMDSTDEVPQIQDSAWQISRLNPDIIPDVIAECNEEINEIEQLLFA